MRGTISFHPVDPELFRDLFVPLVVGRRVSPDAFLAAAIDNRRSWHRARRVQAGLAAMLEAARPPEPPVGVGFLLTLKAKLDRFDFRPDPRAVRLGEVLEPDLHLEGRPYFIAEASAEKVAQVAHDYRTAPDDLARDGLALEQLVRLDPQVARGFEPVEVPEPSPDPSYRVDRLRDLQDLHALGHAARENQQVTAPDGTRRLAAQVLAETFPWRAVTLHAQALPFWRARDVDGLRAVSEAAGIAPFPGLGSPRPLFLEACEAHPALEPGLSAELEDRRSVGGYVAPERVEELVEFLSEHGAAIIRIAARHGEGPRASSMLRSMKEAAVYAHRHGLGYLEASGILPPDLESDQEA